MTARRLLPLLVGLALVWAAPCFAQGEDEAPAEEEPTTDEEEAPAEEAPAPAASTTETAEEGDDVEMSIFRELKTVESQVDDLKEKVFQSKARLLLLEEKVIRGVVSGAKAVIRHVNNLGPSYALESITYYFDGNPIYQKTDVGTKGALSKEKKVQIFEANVPPGNHTLSVTGLIKGKGTGLFAYLADYSFEFSSSYSFVAQDGKTTRLDAQLYKKGGALADYVEGPTIEFKLLDGRKKGKGGDAEEADADEGSEGSGT
ncbi:MAG: dihydrolipoamide acetyltransferase [Proteobacteria bacterium]|nr:dihydrolipoamide acetyltransferase [Pseudomonadota bacterium]